MLEIQIYSDSEDDTTYLNITFQDNGTLLINVHNNDENVSLDKDIFLNNESAKRLKAVLNTIKD